MAKIAIPTMTYISEHYAAWSKSETRSEFIFFKWDPHWRNLNICRHMSIVHTDIDLLLYTVRNLNKNRCVLMIKQAEKKQPNGMSLNWNSSNIWRLYHFTQTALTGSHESKNKKRLNARRNPNVRNGEERKEPKRAAEKDIETRMFE